MTQSPWGWNPCLRYGLMGLPLAFVALPLYVVLPHYYATTYGVPLAALGMLLLGARLGDAVIDPVLGRWSDRLYARARTQSLAVVLAWAAVAATALALGFGLLFFPPSQRTGAVLAWAGACLMLTYGAYSALSILHQSWGALWGGTEEQRGRIVAWREGCGLVGVLLASGASVRWGMGSTALLLAAALLVAWLAWRSAPWPGLAVQSDHAATLAPAGVWLPLTRPNFRALLAVFLVNGIASAVPATLVLFFVQDRLQLGGDYASMFLGLYFFSAALAIPLWLRGIKRWGLARTWGMGMLLAVAVFLGAALLGSGQAAGFALVCALSGAALGSDLTIPGALLAGAIGDNGDRAHAEGAYFGWWNFANKLNLALAAGVSLPALALLGYTPGAQDAAALQALTWAYCLLPCAMKLLAATLLYTLILRKTP